LLTALHQLLLLLHPSHKAFCSIWCVKPRRLQGQSHARLPSMARRQSVVETRFASLKPFLNVETHFYCPLLFLSLDFQHRMDVSKSIDVLRLRRAAYQQQHT